MTAEPLTQELIALRIIRELVPGTIVNLGVGLGFGVCGFFQEAAGVLLHAENGLIGFAGWRDDDSDVDSQIFGQPVGILPGAASVDHVTSFSLIRTGRVDTTILGAFQVDQQGRMASLIAPHMRAGGVGGAMELLQYCRQVIVAIRHLDPSGRSKLRVRCDSPLTGTRPVDLIVTDLGVFRPTGEECLELLEVAPGWSVDEIVERTEATLRIPARVPEMTF